MLCHRWRSWREGHVLRLQSIVQVSVVTVEGPRTSALEVVSLRQATLFSATPGPLTGRRRRHVCSVSAEVYNQVTDEAPEQDDPAQNQSRQLWRRRTETNVQM